MAFMVQWWSDGLSDSAVSSVIIILIQLKFQILFMLRQLAHIMLVQSTPSSMAASDACAKLQRDPDN